MFNHDKSFVDFCYPELILILMFEFSNTGMVYASGGTTPMRPGSTLFEVIFRSLDNSTSRKPYEYSKIIYDIILPSVC